MLTPARSQRSKLISLFEVMVFPVYGLGSRVSAEADKAMCSSEAAERFVSGSAHQKTCVSSKRSSHAAAWKYGNDILSLTVI